MIRLSKYSDFEDLKKIFAVCFTDEYQPRGINIVKKIERWQKLYPVIKFLATFNNPYQYVFNVHVYQDDNDGKIAGLMQTSARSKDQTRWHVDNIAVLPEYRGKGIAKKLLNYMFDTYTAKGANRFTLEVDVKNDNALKLYESIGFRKYTTIHYYKLPSKRINEFKLEKLSIPDGFREYKPFDLKAHFDLYKACTPSFVRIVEQKTIKDFEKNPLEQVSDYIKEVLKKSSHHHFVVEKNNTLIASLEIVAQYRKIPHVLRLLVHTGYEDLNETLLNYAFNFLNNYPQRSVLVAGTDYQKAKLDVLKNFKLNLIASDFLMVKDNFQIVKLHETSESMQLDKKLKPIFFDKLNAFWKNTR